MRRVAKSVRESWRGTSGTPFWLDDPGRPTRRPSLDRHVRADLAIVGAGYSGLWAAVLAKQQDPDRDVVVVDAASVGWAASGRNGGFCSASLTHGWANGRDRFPGELETLQRLGDANLDGLVADVETYGIDCHLERTGELTVATEDYQVAELREAAQVGEGRFLDQDEVRREVASPTYRAGLWDERGTVMIHPAKLAWGLADAAEQLGVRIFEDSYIRRLTRDRDVLRLTARTASITARQVALATNAFPSLVRRVRPYVVPVYDYALVTEPLSREQRRDIAWRHRQGIGDSANQFHYYRLTPDDRILFGGYDAVYHFGRRISPELDTRPETFDRLSEHFFETFPQLHGLRFTHAWGGAIDLCSRFCAFFGTSHGGRTAYAAGYTGLGVGATRFGAQVMLDLLAGEETERTATELVRSKPVPFPPEPFAYAGVQVTRAAIAQADRNEGQRNLWLRTLDRLGLGFDS
jgi:glycine/D-amino acid oxidase-like deaminating enzyme